MIEETETHKECRERIERRDAAVEKDQKPLFINYCEGALWMSQREHEEKIAENRRTAQNKTE